MEPGDPDETNPFTPNEGDDDTTPLIPHREEIPMETRTSTSTPKRSGHHVEETDFGGTSSGRTFVEEKEQQKDEIEKRIKARFKNAKIPKFFSKIGENGDVAIRLDRKRGKWYPILDLDGNILIDDIKGKLLGKSVFEEIADKTEEKERARARIREIDEQIPNAVGEERKRLVEERGRNQEVFNEKDQEIEAIEERLPLRQRIKEIFKKYGFTIIAVSAAVATVIGVIVSNLKSGLTKVAQGVGNGLKELGAKLGQILPGMIGAIASFIFRTAGEVIGFLAKNAWLLIVGLVLFAVEQFRKKNK